MPSLHETLGSVPKHCINWLRWHVPIIPEKWRQEPQNSKSGHGETVPIPRSHLKPSRHGCTLVCKPSTPVRKWTVEAGEGLETCEPAKLSNETLTQTKQKVRTDVRGCSVTCTCAQWHTHTPQTKKETF